MSTVATSLKEKLRQIPSLKAPLPSADFSAFPFTPHQAFDLWLDEAVAAGVREPHAMTLSTMDENGWPDARVLILKNVDERGWHFAINAGSPKGRQIDEQPRVALTFYWPAMGRQIRLRGLATALPAEECAEDFLNRPFGSRTSSIASRQSELLEDDGDLTRAIVEAQAFLSRDPNHVAADWRVYAVKPDVVEFWQGATDRCHKRLRYRLIDGATWEASRLWP